MPRVFSYEQGDGTPAKYANPISISKPSITDTWVNYGAATSIDDAKACEIDITDGQLLYSKSQMLNQKSCVPHSYNTGNYYNFPAASTNTSEPASSSICPKGWNLPQNTGNTSYSHILDMYGIDNFAATKSNYDSGLVNLPLSYLRSGYYYSDGTLYYQGISGVYRMTSQRLGFHSSNLNPTSNTDANRGYSVRCVGR